MIIKILVFDKLKEEFGFGEREFEFDEEITAGEAATITLEEHGSEASVDDFKLSVNENFVEKNYALKYGDELGLIPLKTGG